MKKTGTWFLKNIELCFWIASVILLFFMDNPLEGNTLCLFHRMGFTYCPGCGIGHSINAALHFNFKMSFQQHPFGLLAVLIIFYRVGQLAHLKKSII